MQGAGHGAITIVKKKTWRSREKIDPEPDRFRWNDVVSLRSCVKASAIYKGFNNRRVAVSRVANQAGSVAC